ncbi:MAG: nitroreductase family protein [Alphaproteobacteria bacterium]
MSWPIDADGEAMLALLGSQRAHREILPDPIPDELVERLLVAATHAPSAENRQPWAFVVVRDEAARARIGEIAAEVWRAGAREHSRERLGERLFADVDRWASGGLGRAPVVIVVCGDRDRSDPRSLAASVYPAAQNLCLAAHALGLGSLFSTLATASPDLARLLSLPPNLVPMVVVPVGRPARRLGPPRRAALSTRAFRERWGSPW